MTHPGNLRVMGALAKAEWILLRRNGTVLLASAAVPLAMTIGTAVLTVDNTNESAAVALALLLLLVLGMGVYMTATLTLTARREDLYLKRIRTSEAGDATILSGVLGPTVLGGITQVAMAFLVLQTWGNLTLIAPLPVLAGTFLTLVLVLLAAVATTGVVNSTDQADAATLPFFTFVVLTGLWSAFDPRGIVQRFLPGGALMETAHASVGDPATAWSTALPALGILLAWCLLFAVLARHAFRWEPRR